VHRETALSLTVVNNVESTHFRSGERPTLLDLFATNTPEEVMFLT
jgi:hypothetical protein